MIVANVELTDEVITELCRRYGVEELSVFGSALREDFSPDSDVDFLVVFSDNDYGPWMSKLTDMERELGQLLGRKVEVVPKHDLKWVIRDRVLEGAQVVYAQANHAV